VQGSIPSHHHAHQAEVQMQMYIEGMCAMAYQSRE
jgi:hypothetical protein